MGERVTRARKTNRSWSIKLSRCDVSCCDKASSSMTALRKMSSPRSLSTSPSGISFGHYTHQDESCSPDGHECWSLQHVRSIKLQQDAPDEQHLIQPPLPRLLDRLQPPVLGTVMLLSSQLVPHAHAMPLELEAESIVEGLGGRWS